jgi:acetyltransferase EpsM
MTARIPLYVFGAGGHGKVVAEAAFHCDRFAVRGFLDDDADRWGGEWYGLPVIGGREALDGLEETAEVALAVGANRTRAEMARAIRARGRALATIVHPTAVIAGTARVGEGTYVAPLAVLHSDARVGHGGIVNTGAVVEHDCQVEDWVHLSPRATLGGEVHVEEGVHVGMGAIVLPGLTLGRWATLGAGAVMIASLPPEVVAVGVPARVREPVG